jgi:hypothetical protein
MRANVATGKPALSRLTRYFGVLVGSSALFAEGIATTAVIAGKIAIRLGTPPPVQAALLSIFEQWDGKGAPAGLRAEGIPVASRIVLPTFFFVPVHRLAGRDASVEMMKSQRGKIVDPSVVDAFLVLAEDADFWIDFESEDIRVLVLGLEPAPEAIPGGDASLWLPPLS